MILTTKGVYLLGRHRTQENWVQNKSKYMVHLFTLLFACLPPSAQFPGFMVQISLDSDYKVAKTCTGILYLVDRYVQMITHSRRFFNMSVAVYLYVYIISCYQYHHNDMNYGVLFKGTCILIDACVIYKAASELKYEI